MIGEKTAVSDDEPSVIGVLEVWAMAPLKIWDKCVNVYFAHLTALFGVMQGARRLRPR